ncbi:recombinase family protein [Muricauda sp. 40Bstr401]|uniref:Recombinase family protein n=1 Tax=Flagellimonas sediminis TaxID=2696468 RepID=A0A6I5KRA7_9FLAO|nr:recombinase family protein [Allomuricauda sediminis]
MTKLKGNGVRFRSITKPFIDTTKKSSHSEFIIKIFAALAQMERCTIIERTKADLESTRPRVKFWKHRKD